MYLTAHRVRSTQGQTGVNSFLYRDREIQKSNLPTSVLVPNLGERTLVRTQTSVPPGGNTVLGYLDIEGTDDTPPDEVREAIDSLAKLLECKEPPLRIAVNGISVGFSRTIGMVGREKELLDELKTALLAIMTQ